ncbi:hypothetical protein Ancab_027478 [Ancistrocladus abbreviatus]
MQTMITGTVVLLMMLYIANGEDTNPVFSPCLDAKVQKWDGFTFGLAFSSKDNFFFNQTQLSPCDNRLHLASQGAQLAVFRPKVDQISLLTINATTFNPVGDVMVTYKGKAGGFMVAFAGQKYAARSSPVFVADDTHTITSFTLVLEFHTGILNNLYWKKLGCDSCKGQSSFCVDRQDCAVPTSKCKSNGGSIDCSIGIQLTFSGTDKNDEVLNSWYEVKNLGQHSLYGLFADLRDSVSSQYNNFL